MITNFQINKIKNDIVRIERTLKRLEEILLRVEERVEKSEEKITQDINYTWKHLKAIRDDIETLKEI